MTAPAGESLLVRSLRTVLQAQQQLSEEIALTDSNPARITVRRHELVLRLREHQSALVRGGLSVPRTITDEIRQQTHELALTSTRSDATLY